jgi:hypothetical protein
MSYSYISYKLSVKGYGYIVAPVGLRQKAAGFAACFARGLFTKPAKITETWYEKIKPSIPMSYLPYQGIFLDTKWYNKCIAELRTGRSSTASHEVQFGWN